MMNRRKFSTGTALALATAGLAPAIVTGANAVEVDENGLHVQDWFLQSFMEIAEDQSTLSEQDKHLVLLFEQRGCPYCKQMHEVNFAVPEITDYIKQHFGVLQINLWGSNPVTNLDGTEMEEKEFARQLNVNFTPTIIFLRQGDLTGIPIVLAQAARMPGYLKPFHFLSMFEFVAEKHYEEDTFQNYLKEKIARYQAEGKKIAL